MTALNKELKLLNLSVFLRFHMFLMPVLYLFYHEYGISVGDFFLLQGLNMFLCLLLDVPAGYLADIYSKRKILICSGVLLFIRYALLYFWPSYTMIFVGEILYAFVVATFVGTSDSYVYELLQTENKTIKMLKRYGRLYFYISLGMSISSLSGALLFDWFGADMVILITMIYTSVSTALLFFLPETHQNKKTNSISSQYKSLYVIFKNSFKNVYLKNLMIFSAFLTAAYQIFMWSMQPLMKVAFIPVALFGVVFFANHVCRAAGSYFADALSKMISLKRLGYMTYYGFLACFVAAMLISYIPSVTVNMILLLLICIMIGFQVAFLITAIAHIHDQVKSDERATFASINSMWGRLTTAVCMFLSKIILDSNNLSVNLLIFMGLFAVAIMPLNRFIRSHTK